MTTRDSPVPAEAEALRGAALDATFTGFFQQHYDSVIRFLSFREADRTMVEDVAQETFIAGRERWADIRSYDKPVAWVLQVARNKLTDAQRARGRLPTVPLDETGHSPAVPPGTDWEARELLASWLRRLPPRHGDVFALAYDEWSDREIAQILGLAYATVRAYKADARERVRRMAEEAGFTVPTGRRRR